jgi:serine/threonine protein kinase
MNPRDIEVDPEGFLGRGAGGLVTRALHKPTGTPLAIKQVQLHDKGKRDQLLNDLRTLLEGKQCPQLVTLYSAYLHKASGRVHLALEYMDMGSLQDLLRVHQRPFPEQHVAVIADQVVRALEFLHHHKLIHRDIKPGNILLHSSGAVKLSDFGISKTLDNTANICDTFIGTAIYMSPERVFGKDYSLSSDIWSLGMVVFETVSGKFPFPSLASFPVLFDCLCNLPEPRLDASVFSSPVCDFVCNCLQREPLKRLSAGQLRQHVFLSSANHVDFSQFLLEIKARRNS